MKKYTEELQKYLKLVVSLVTRYSFVLFLIAFATMASYLITRIGYLSRLEPTEAQITAKTGEIKKTNTDKASILKLKDLESRNISVESLFDNGRTNPFED